MGWFWADTPQGPSRSLRSNGTPPPSCPMHADAPFVSSYPPQKSSQLPLDASCPIGAPISPLQSTDQSSSSLSKFNPLNYMPSNISQARSKHQTVALPVERTVSSIPRGDADSNWEYPSPQQMYNAMLRKGYDDTPEDAVESMVAVHNFLNEGAWEEIERWEERFSRGLGPGWQMCRMGEEGFSTCHQTQRHLPKPRLLRFQGRPKDITPKAQILGLLGWIYPAKFGCEPPFDRHDWYVQRQRADGSSREVRYVIDYYSGPPEPTGEPVFYLDVRPAIDGPTAAVERMMRWGGDVWFRASGAKARLENPSE